MIGDSEKPWAVFLSKRRFLRAQYLKGQFDYAAYRLKLEGLRHGYLKASGEYVY